MNCTIFYSWQSDLPNSSNRGFIEAALEKAAKTLRSDESVRVEPVIDRDTQNTPGAPDISATIFGKIAEADVFVCDVSFINAGTQLPNGQAARPTPNPNVLIELGYAVHCLGWEHIVLVLNTATGQVEELPFDLRGRSVTAYAMTRDDAKAEERNQLAGKLVGALRVILLQVERQRLAAAQIAAPLTPSALEQAVAAIEDGKPSASRLTRTFWAKTLEGLNDLAPDTKSDRFSESERVEQLKGALSNALPLVTDVAHVCKSIAERKALAVGDEFASGFQLLLDRCDVSANFFGSYRAIDFDFWKFLAHELWVIFVAALIRENRWQMLAGVLDRSFMLTGARFPTPTPVSWCYLSRDVASLSSVSRGSGTLSLHSVWLQDHFQNDALNEQCSFESFMGADYFLFLRTRLTPEADAFFQFWYPYGARSLSTLPAFIRRLHSQKLATQMLPALNMDSLDVLRQRIEAAQEGGNWQNKLNPSETVSDGFFSPMSPIEWRSIGKRP